MQSETTDLLQDVMTFLSTYGLDVVGGVAILIVGYLLSGIARKVVYRVLGRAKRMDDLVRDLMASLVKYFVIAITLIAVLSNFGVEVTSLIAVLGAAGLAVGLALQGVLSNLAAGVMLLIFRPFKTGDYIETAGHAGTVKSLSLTSLELATPDNIQILLPNGQVWGSAIKNFSFHETRRVDFSVGIGYEDDIEAARRAIGSVIESDARASKDPAPVIAVSELGDSAVMLVVRVWCQAVDYWDLRFDLTKALKERLDADGISIPYPQRTVHIADASPARIVAK